MTHCCDVCGTKVFVWHYVNYEHTAGYWEQDIIGQVQEGSGQCEYCGKWFCVDHNELDDGLCPECLKELEAELYEPTFGNIELHSWARPGSARQGKVNNE